MIEAEYRSPYLNHATMEPQTCTAWLKPDGFLEVWTSTQNGEASMAAAAEAAGLPLEKVEVHKMMLGGGFGRRGGPQDFVRQGVAIAKAMPGVPVKLMWSREEDMQHGFYRPASIVRMKAGLDAQGNLDRACTRRSPVRRSCKVLMPQATIKDGIDFTRGALVQRHALRGARTSRSTTRCATATCRSASGVRRASRTRSTASASSTNWRWPRARTRSNSGWRC